MNKITIQLDVTKLNKDRIKERSYQNKEGKQVFVKEVTLDLVPLHRDKVKVIKEGDGWQLRKTHFVTESPTKEERAAKVKMPAIGSGIQFFSIDDIEVPKRKPQSEMLTSDGTAVPFPLDEDEIPF